MAYDGITMAAVCHELNQTLSGSRVERIYQPHPMEIVLHLRSRDTIRTLICSAQSRHPRVHLSQARPDNPPAPPAFCMLLRKHLSGARLLSVEQTGLERILTIHFRSFDDFGEGTRKILICEIMGKHSNIILSAPDDSTVLRILGSAKTVTETMSRHRLVMPGESYEYPPPQEKLPLSGITEESLAKVLAKTEAATPVQMLVNTIMGLGPDTAREIMFRTAGGEKVHPLEIARSLTIQLTHVNKIIENQTFEPCIAFNANGVPMVISPISLTIFNRDQIIEYPTMNEALDVFYTAILHKERENELRRQLLQIVASSQAKTEKKKRLQERELVDMKGADKFRLYGEMLTAALHLAHAGVKEIEVINYYSPEQEMMRIPLDPARSPQDNVRRFFKKYRKLKDGEVFLRKRIKETLNELNYLGTLQLAIERADFAIMEEIRAEMVQTELIREKKNKIIKEDLSSQPLHFVSADGIDIFVGRNNRQNDRLTLKSASSYDTWLHTKDIPGAHVIIKSATPPEETLLEAAKLAALHSRASASSNVPVDYTLVKHVRKPKGAKPGMVIYDNHRTIYVTAD
ncbi:MAG: NFACT family protein [Clostridiales bacterium]|jgi:predicted ribosome quality control (RQC) complex YloA/Tae2 family protein|nr:NFACT family protein [Clostridiales bacterium]